MLLGRLTKDPEVRYAENANGRMCITRYNLAVDRPSKKDGEQSTDFISCVAFGKTAEFAEKYLHKGMKMAIVGRIQTGSYEKDGVKHYTTDVVVENHYFCEGKSSNSGEASEHTASENEAFMQMAQFTDDEIPFN